jgi:hypothetical protein
MLVERLLASNSTELFSDSLRLVAHALRLTPEETLRHAHNWKAEHRELLPVSGVISKMTYASLVTENRVAVRATSQNFLFAAIKDVGDITDVLSGQYPHLSMDERVNIMSHPQSIQTVARLAMRTDIAMEYYIRNILEATGALTEDGAAYVVNDDSLTVGSMGCPAAGYAANLSSEGKIDPLPIFTRLVPWAVEVHLLSQEERVIRVGKYTLRLG